MYSLSLDAGEVNWIIEGANDAVVAMARFFSNADESFTGVTYP